MSAGLWTPRRSVRALIGDIPYSPPWHERLYEFDETYLRSQLY